MPLSFSMAEHLHLVSGRRPRRPVTTVKALDSSSEERVQGDPRRPGGLPHYSRDLRIRSDRASPSSGGEK